MRILHTSDWHLGKRLDNFTRLEEQIAVMDEICILADHHNVNVVIVAGDLFDTINPPNDATQLLYRTLKRLTNDGCRAVIAIAGNHDSPERIEAPDPLARECGILFAGYPHSQLLPIQLDSGIKVTHSKPGFIELQVPSCQTPLRLLLTPYANEIRLRTYLGYENKEEALREVLRQNWQALADKHCDAKGINLLTTHLFMTRQGNAMPEEPEDEKPILYVGGAQPVFSTDVPKAIQYVALGHLHRKQTIDENPCPIVYSGSPLAYSFGEADQNKYVMLVDVEAGEKAQVTPLPLTSGRRLLRKRFDDIDDAVMWLNANQEAYIELTLVSDTYLTAEERKRINDAHPYIVAIIPEVKNTGIDANGNTSSIDPTQSMESLFVDFFKTRNKGQEPNERLMALMKEVMAQE